MKTEITYQEAQQQAEALFLTLGLKTHISAPFGEVKEQWPCIRYNVTFSANGQNEAIEYRLGVGHVKWPNTFEQIPHSSPAYMVPVFNTIRNNPNAQLKDKAEHAEAAAFLAVTQKVYPKPYEVLASACSEAWDAHNESFENWACNFGMDSDSIKAKSVYDYCVTLYFRLSALIGVKNIQSMAEFHNQF